MNRLGYSCRFPRFVHPVLALLLALLLAFALTGCKLDYMECANACEHYGELHSKFLKTVPKSEQVKYYGGTCDLDHSDDICARNCQDSWDKEKLGCVMQAKSRADARKCVCQ